MKWERGGAHTSKVTRSSTHIQDVSIGLVLVRILEVRVAYEDGVHVGTGILVQLVVAGDHNHCYLHVTQDAQFISLLQEASFTLAEGDLKTMELSAVHQKNRFENMSCEGGGVQ